MDAVPARLAVTAGPDQGKVFGLSGDIMHLGTSDENQIVLSDVTLAEHHASIASRNGRYAIFVPPGPRVEIDGTLVPSDKWLWLPATATLKMGALTTCRFESVLTGASAGAAGNGAKASVSSSTVTTPAVPAATDRAPETGSGSGELGQKVTSTKRRKAARKSQVARFITDQPGDLLVKLGEDGQLPELTLLDAAQKPLTERREERNPLLLYGALAFSFVMSLGMLLLDPSPATTTSGDKSQARAALAEYFGDDGSRLEPYQKALRQALVEFSQGDVADERREYRKVLQMLNAADIRDPANLNGLTGRQTGRGRASDQQLREHLETLLSN